MPTSSSSISPDTPESSPNTGEPHQTIADYEWALERFTHPDWTVDTIAFEDNDHADVRCTVLEATLSHSSGSIIQCSPFDPWDHQPGPTIYRRHRVRLRDALSDESYYLTVDEDTLPAFETPLPAYLSESPDTHPIPDADEYATFHAQEQVHYTDSEVVAKNPDRGRGYNIDGIPSTVIAIFGAAQRVKAQTQEQTALDAFCSPA